MKALWIIFGILIFLAIGFIISHFALIEYFFKMFFGRISLEKLNDNMFDTPCYDKSKEKIIAAKRRIEELEHKEVSVTSEDGLKLVAQFYDFGKDKTAIMMHGFHSLPLKNFSVIAESLIENGYNVLLPYERAHGKSEGEYISYGFKESDDVLKWIEYIDENTSAEKILVYGTSMGGTTVGIASEKIKSDKVKVLVIDCGFTTIEALLEYILETKHAPKKLLVPGLKRRAKKRIGMSFTDADAEKSLKSDKIPTLFIYGSQDNVVPKECIEKSFAACAAEKDLIIVEGSGHGVAIADGGDEALEKFYNFVNKYM